MLMTRPQGCRKREHARNCRGPGGGGGGHARTGLQAQVWAGVVFLPGLGVQWWLACRVELDSGCSAQHESQVIRWLSVSMTKCRHRLWHPACKHCLWDATAGCHAQKIPVRASPLSSLNVGRCPVPAMTTDSASATTPMHDSRECLSSRPQAVLPPTAEQSRLCAA